MPVREDVRETTATKPKIGRPPLYKVVLVNDDYTPGILVVAILKGVFKLGDDRAIAVMAEAHMKGSSLVFSYAKDVAETKAKEAEDIAKKEGYPLKMPVERE